MTTPTLADATATTSAEPTLMATFTLGDLYLGVPALEVQEVLKYQEMTTVPQAPSEVSGLINLRGDIVCAIDLRRRFGMAPREHKRPMNLVLTKVHHSVSLLVDEISDVVAVDPATFERTPTTVDAVARQLLCGTYKRPDRLLLVLDVAKAIDVGAPR